MVFIVNAVCCRNSILIYYICMNVVAILEQL
jgi:hypothetical protein